MVKNSSARLRRACLFFDKDAGAVEDIWTPSIDASSSGILSHSIADCGIEWDWMMVLRGLLTRVDAERGWQLERTYTI
jgi:hypothetical protein